MLVCQQRAVGNCVQRPGAWVRPGSTRQDPSPGCLPSVSPARRHMRVASPIRVRGVLPPSRSPAASRHRRNLKGHYGLSSLVLPGGSLRPVAPSLPPSCQARARCAPLVTPRRPGLETGSQAQHRAWLRAASRCLLTCRLLPVVVAPRVLPPSLPPSLSASQEPSGRRDWTAAP